VDHGRFLPFVFWTPVHKLPYPKLSDDREKVIEAGRPGPSGEELLRRLQHGPSGATWAAPKTAGEDTLSPGPAAAGPGADYPVIADYEVLGVLGQGGMGVVYQAWHTKLKRVVALKMVLAGAHASAEDLARFRVEAEAAARLAHPNIAQVHEVGAQDGLPFLALEYVEGSSLAQKLQGTPLPARPAAHLIETLARAMHHSHQRGIIHRDLKPANVLLAQDGTPKITDFGLAKLIVGGSDQTCSGALLGTPAYMAPEQAGGKTREIGPPVDIYALGAILYELLTGRPPFQGESVADTLQQVLCQEPVPPRQLQPKTPRDLDTICLKCLEKAPHQRYASAADLAEDLRRFQAGEPIRARPVGPLQRAGKWARRKPAAAALVMVCLLAAAGLLAGGLWYQARLAESLVDVRYQRDQAELKRIEAETKRMEAEQNLYLAHVPLAQRAWEAARVERMRELLDGVRPQSTKQKDLRNFEWHYLRRLGHSSLLTLTGHSGPVTAVAFRARPPLLASASADGTIKFWDTTTGQERPPALAGHTGRVTAVAFSPDGKQLASAGEDRTVCLWDVDSGKKLHVLKEHTRWVSHVAFSPDGQHLASASSDRTIKLWDARSGRLYPRRWRTE
jgi:hypothetical protein